MHEVGIACIRPKNYLPHNTLGILPFEEGFSSRFLRIIFLLALLCLYTEAQAVGKVYRNDKFRYTVFYPDHWFPSGIVYANAFEVRTMAAMT